MRATPTITLLDGYSLVNSVNSAPMRLEFMGEVAIQAIFEEADGYAPTGTIKLQVSVDQGSDELGSNVDNWTDVTDSDEAISAAGNVAWDIETCFKWIRAVYTFTSGAGTLTVNAFAKRLI